MKMLKLLPVLACALVSPGGARADAQPAVWTLRHGPADFLQGSFGDSGVNIYSGATTGVQMIHRSDLNNDGFLDLAVGQSHNTTDNEDAFIYWGTESGPQSLMPPIPEMQPLGRLLHQLRLREKGLTRLPSAGGGPSLIADLNSDGWPEIVFCNFIHNHAVEQPAFIYWGSREGYDAARRTRLPTLRALDVAAGDFNQDGFIDLCIANGGSEMGGRFEYDQHLESYIYWNGPLGFSAERRASLPSVSASACAAGSVSGDGSSVLALVNNHPDEHSIYLYSSGPDGFSADRREVRRDGNPVGVEFFDVNADRRADLIVLDADNAARIYLATAAGLSREPWMQLPTAAATVCRAADLNNDGFVDLVFPNHGTPGQAQQHSYIYWGGSNGFSAEKRGELPTSWAADAAIADFNGDGLLDVAFANERSELTYDVDSYVYFNSSSGFDPARRSDLQGLGPVSAVSGDLNRDGKQDLLLVNRYSGRTAGDASSPAALIYWGNAAHTYSPAAMSTLPTNGDCHAVADLDENGFPDIIFANGHIYYGNEQGYDVGRRTDLGITGNGVTVADLNRDGYLDLLLPAAKEARIVWGSDKGYDRGRSTALPLTTRITQAASVADLNRDGALDLIFPDVDSPRVDFYWGDAGGSFDERQRTSIDVHSASTVTIADVNHDGWLDLIFGGTYDRKNKGRHLRYGVLLFGAPDGYSLERSQRFEAFDSSEQVVADLNKDGYLDMVVSNYHGHTTRSLPVFIYWGDASGKFHESRRATLPAESALRLTVLDLNQDGWLDITAFNHQRDGDHTVGANIFWGSERGFDFARRQWVPAFGVHFGERHNLGNIYDRRLEEAYISPPLAIPEGVQPARIAWEARTPHRTAVEFQLRSAESQDALQAAAWRGADRETQRFKRTPSDFATPPGHNWLQYRAILITPDGGSTPLLTEVTLSEARDD